MCRACLPNNLGLVKNMNVESSGAYNLTPLCQGRWVRIEVSTPWQRLFSWFHTSGAVPCSELRLRPGVAQNQSSTNKGHIQAQSLYVYTSCRRSIECHNSLSLFDSNLIKRQYTVYVGLNEIKLVVFCYTDFCLNWCWMYLGCNVQLAGWQLSVVLTESCECVKKKCVFNLFLHMMQVIFAAVYCKRSWNKKT